VLLLSLAQQLLLWWCEASTLWLLHPDRSKHAEAATAAAAEGYWAHQQQAVELASAVLQAAGHSCTTEQFLVLIKVRRACARGGCVSSITLPSCVPHTCASNNSISAGTACMFSYGCSMSRHCWADKTIQTCLAIYTACMHGGGTSSCHCTCMTLDTCCLPFPDCLPAYPFACRLCTGWQLSSMTRGTSAYSTVVPQLS
jgi:hypothetical protein